MKLPIVKIKVEYTPDLLNRFKYYFGGGRRTRRPQGGDNPRGIWLLWFYFFALSRGPG
jgi:hypothetical protein